MPGRAESAPDDPFAEIVEKRFAEEVSHEGKDAGALREARRKLDDKAGEVRRLQAELTRTRQEIERREKVKAAPAAPAPQKQADDTALADLRRKVAELKGSLNERYEEKYDLKKDKAKKPF